MPTQTDKTNTAPAVHIAREHQSAPKEHWADKEVAKAAEEIREGQFRPDLSADADLIGMVGMTRSEALKDPRQATTQEKLDSFGDMADSLALAQHPRVQEMLARLELEKTTAKTTEEQMEKAQMLHEVNERVARKNCWDGQGRWVGKDSQEMRVVNVLSWKQWLDRLAKVVGDDRVYVQRYMDTRTGRISIMARAGMVDGYSPLIIPGQPHAGGDELIPVATIQPMSPEWMVMRFNEYGEPTCPKYLGWRTALLCLIAKKIITEKEAHKAFPLGMGPAGDWYRQQLFEMRSRDGVVN